MASHSIHTLPAWHVVVVRVRRANVWTQCGCTRFATSLNESDAQRRHATSLTLSFKSLTAALLTRTAAALPRASRAGCSTSPPSPHRLEAPLDASLPKSVHARSGQSTPRPLPFISDRERDRVVVHLNCRHRAKPGASPLLVSRFCQSLQLPLPRAALHSRVGCSRRRSSAQPFAPQGQALLSPRKKIAASCGAHHAHEEAAAQTESQHQSCYPPSTQLPRAPTRHRASGRTRAPFHIDPSARPPLAPRFNIGLQAFAVWRALRPWPLQRRGPLPSWPGRTRRC